MRLSFLAVLSLLTLSTLALAEPGQRRDEVRPPSAALDDATSTPSLVPVEVSAPALVDIAALATSAPDIDAHADPSLGEVVRLAAQAISSRNWGLLACALVLGFVYVVRRFGASWFPWLSSDAAGMGLSLLVAAALQVSSTLLAGKPLSLSMVIGALATAAGASGLYAWGKKLGAAHQYATAKSRAH